jgi:hypothetical protein
MPDIATDLDIALQIVQEIAQAGPILLQDAQASEQYAKAILAFVANKGSPTADQWAATKAQLDAGSAVIATAVQQAQTEIDSGTDTGT